MSKVLQVGHLPKIMSKVKKYIDHSIAEQIGDLDLSNIMYQPDNSLNASPISAEQYVSSGLDGGYFTDKVFLRTFKGRTFKEVLYSRYINGGYFTDGQRNRVIHGGYF